MHRPRESPYQLSTESPEVSIVCSIAPKDGKFPHPRSCDGAGIDPFGCSGRLSATGSTSGDRQDERQHLDGAGRVVGDRVEVAAALPEKQQKVLTWGSLKSGVLVVVSVES